MTPTPALMPRRKVSAEALPVRVAWTTETGDRSVSYADLRREANRREIAEQQAENYLTALFNGAPLVSPR